MKGFGDTKISFINYVKVWIDIINSRFGAFTKLQKDYRVWSVEIFESIVAFKINRKASKLKSEFTWNIQPSEEPKDYRNKDKKNIKDNFSAIQSIIKKAFSIYKDN